MCLWHDGTAGLLCCISVIKGDFLSASVGRLDSSSKDEEQAEDVAPNKAVLLSLGSPWAQGRRAWCDVLGKKAWAELSHVGDRSPWRW